eukprot:941096-Alexandrium_andersonii.AAC.1
MGEPATRSLVRSGWGTGGLARNLRHRRRRDCAGRRRRGGSRLGCRRSGRRGLNNGHRPPRPLGIPRGL